MPNSFEWKRTKMNLDRASYAFEAFRVFLTQCVHDRKQRAVEEKQDYMLSDMICDTLHLAARRGQDPDVVLRMAVSHFEVERTGQED